MVKKETIRAISWTEKVIYVECPECGHVECKGRKRTGGFSWSDSATWECDKCKKAFEVDDCTNMY